MFNNGILSAGGCAALFLAGLTAFAFDFRGLLNDARRVERREWYWLGLWMAVNLTLCLVGGIRVPGAPNSNGFGPLNNLLRPHGSAFGLYGNGPDGLYAVLLFGVLPNHEIYLITAQVVFSVLAVPATYAVWRLWSGEREGARWSAAVMAVIPSTVFFSATEEALVPAVFFELLTLAAIGVAARRSRLTPLFAAVFMGAFTAQFRYILHIIPLIALAFALAAPEGRQMLRRPGCWIAGILLAVLLAPSAMHIVHLLSGHGHNVEMQEAGLEMFYKAMLPMSGTGVPGNVFLTPSFTPPLLPLLVLLSVIFGRPRLIVLAALGSALMLTVLGLIPGGTNTARLQLPAQPFYAMVAGQGLACLFQILRRLTHMGGNVENTIGTVLLIGLIALFPGPIGQVYSYQLERRAAKEGLPHVPDGCTILHAGVGHVPSYLSAEGGRSLEWVNARSVPDLDDRLKSGCWIYYRSTRCHQLGSPPFDLAGDCRSFEEKLHLEPLFVREIDALSFHGERYGSKSLLVGFYRIVTVK